MGYLFSCKNETYKGFLFICRNADVREIEKRLVPDGSPYKDDAKIPVFSWSSQPFSAEEIVTIILGKYDNEVLCTSPPINVSHVTFLVNTGKLRQPNNLKCDDMGAWPNNGARKKIVFVKFDCPNDTATMDLSADSEDHNLYTLKRSYHKNKSSEDVKKIIAIIEGK